MLRRRFLPWLAVLTATVVLPTQGGGCDGKTACVKAEGGASASAAQVTAFFTQSCTGSGVPLVDGEATFDGEYCCYPVTQSSSDGDIVCGAGGASGVGGSGGSGGIGGAEDTPPEAP